MVTRPDVACLCVDLGVHAALTVYGEQADLLIERFVEEHSGPGHLPVNPAKDWHGKAGEFRQYVERVRRELATLGAAEDVPRACTLRDIENVDPGERL